MNPTAAKEISDLIMLDDFVARKHALDNWTRKWIATIMLEHPAPLHQVRAMEKFHGKEAVASMARVALLERMLTGIVVDNNVKGVRVEVEESAQTRTTRLEMHVVLQEPRELDAGKKAAQRMRDMASGSFEDPTSGE